MVQVDFETAAAFLKARDRFVLLCHAFPDGDTIGSAAALCEGLRQLGKQVYIRCPHDIPKKFAGLTKGLLSCDFAEETVVAVDVADRKLLGHLDEEYGERVDLCIDHHPSNTGYAGKLCLNADAGANCENIYRILTALSIRLTPGIATALFVGLSTDTGCFKYANTTPETHRIAAALMEIGIPAGEINRNLFEIKTRARIELERQILDGMRFYFGGVCAVVTITKQMREESGCDDSDMDGISSLARTVEGVRIGVTVRERSDGRYKISLRTVEPVDASAICKVLGGGGHIRAAGCELDGPIETVMERLLSVIKGAL
ncbi:MAG: DHH family phosphoesterase [Candidatus Howiella sp.]|jgi:phosphoesterase RecJ-like protein